MTYPVSVQENSSGKGNDWSKVQRGEGQAYVFEQYLEIKKLEWMGCLGEEMETEVSRGRGSLT
jgi:hypothetical protein